MKTFKNHLIEGMPRGMIVASNEFPNHSNNFEHQTLRV